MTDFNHNENLPPETEAYGNWLLKDCGYKVVRIMPDGKHWIAITRFMFTWGLITGRVGDYHGYDDRWCYKSLNDAVVELYRYNGVDEPQGWHRHPDTGRRRPDGDASRETVQF